MSIFWRSKRLLGMPEVTYGTDPVPGVNNGVLAKNIRITPMEGNDVDRELELPYFGGTGTIAINLHAKLEFDVELAPSGTAGIAPGWGPLIRMCGCAETIVANTSVTYNPITDDPESGTLYFQVGGTLYKIVGARGNVSIEANASGIPYLKFAIWGLFRDPAEEASAVPNLANFQKPQEVTTANTPVFTLGGTPLVMRNFMLDAEKQVEPRFLVGQEEILITDGVGKVETTVNAVPLTTFDPYAAAKASTNMPVVLQHGTAAGRIATINVPNAQLQRPAGLEQNQNITEWPLNFVTVPVNGNDQWSLVLT